MTVDSQFAPAAEMPELPGPVAALFKRLDKAASRQEKVDAYEQKVHVLEQADALRNTRAGLGTEERDKQKEKEETFIQKMEDKAAPVPKKLSAKAAPSDLDLEAKLVAEHMDRARKHLSYCPDFTSGCEKCKKEMKFYGEITLGLKKGIQPSETQQAFLHSAIMMSRETAKKEMEKLRKARAEGNLVPEGFTSDVKEWIQNKATAMKEFGAACRARCCGTAKNVGWFTQYRLAVLMGILGLIALVSTALFVYSRKRRTTPKSPTAMQMEGLKDFTLEYEDGTLVPDENIKGAELRIENGSSQKVYSLSGGSDQQMLNSLKRTGLMKGEYKARLGHRTGGGGFRFSPVVLRLKENIPNPHQYEGTEAGKRKFDRNKAMVRRARVKQGIPLSLTEMKDFYKGVQANAQEKIERLEIVEKEEAREVKEAKERPTQVIARDIPESVVAKAVDDYMTKNFLVEPEACDEPDEIEDATELLRQKDESEQMEEAFQTVEMHQKFIGSIQNLANPEPYCCAVRIFDTIEIPEHILDMMDKDGCKIIQLAGGNGYTISTTIPYVREDWIKVEDMVDTVALPIPTALASWPAFTERNMVIPTIGSARAKFYVKNPIMKGGQSLDTVDVTVVEDGGRPVVLYKTDHMPGICFSPLCTDETPPMMFALHHSGAKKGKLCEGVCITRGAIDQIQEIGMKSPLAQSQKRWTKTAF